MILSPKKRRYKASEILIFNVVGGHYVCRCGNMIAVSAKLAGEIRGQCLLPEGYYDIDEIDIRLVPDCLKTEEERGQ